MLEIDENAPRRDPKIPRLIGKRCCAKNKSTGSRCTRKPCIGNYSFCATHLKSECGLAVRKSEKLAKLGVPPGLGLYACGRSFERGDMVALYGGEKLTDEEFNKRYGDPDTAAFAITSGNGWVFDGAAAGSAASYANEAIDIGALLKEYGPEEFEWAYNCESRRRLLANAKSVALKHGKNIMLVATRRISDGDEILINYGAEYWSPLSK